MRTFPLIVGPTAGGKSSLALALAHALAREPDERGPGEIVSADSIQVYRGLDIGSAKPSPAERAEVPHHLIDIREPTDSFSVSEWLDLANTAIDDVRARGRTPIVIGGTHLYAKALLEGLFDGPPADEALRARLAELPAGELRARLERVDPDAAARIHPNDLRRTIRALEVHELTGASLTQHQAQWDRGGHRPDVLLVILDWPSEAINRRINARVRQMVAEGLIEEVRSLWEAGRLGPQAREGLAYKQLSEAFEAGGSPGQIDEALERTKIETRRFAKNQRTWMRRLLTTPGALRIDAEATETPDWADLVMARLRAAMEQSDN